MIFAWSVITYEITDQAVKCQVYVKKIALYVSEPMALSIYQSISDKRQIAELLLFHPALENNYNGTL